MKTSTAFGAAAAAAIATYFLDPAAGRRRRALVRDNVAGKLSHLDEAGAVAAVDLRNRTRGLLAELRARFGSKQASDEVLRERVRAKLGRVLSHPGAVEVTANAGTVTLRGPLLAEELERVCKAVKSVPGVRKVIDAVQVHEQAGNISALQGGRRRLQLIDVLQEHWSPATRTLVGAGGATLLTRALVNRSPLSLALGLAGAAMLARAGSNMSIARMLGRHGPCIGFTKTIHIAAPLEDVFAFWQNFENFPRFMRNVRAVRRLGDDAWHWEVAGPMGTSVEWDAVVTAFMPNALLGWVTTPDSPVEHAGVVHFERAGDGTRVQVEMTYNPPGAALGHAVASLFGTDPRSEMDEDLMRLKIYLETGHPAHDAAAARDKPAEQRPAQTAEKTPSF